MALTEKLQQLSKKRDRFKNEDIYDYEFRETIGTIKKSVVRKTGENIWDSYFTTRHILEGIRKRSTEQVDAKFNDLYSLLCREDLVISAINNLKGNKGTGTAGVDGKTLDAMEKTDIQKIIDELKDGTYKFKPIKRIMIPKPGKKEKRPLGIPTFEDRIIQEMIRMILEAVYEPCFTRDHRDCNYGFRKGRSCQQAIDVTRQKGQNLEWCIEGDIKGAFNNVVHKKLISILREKIKDENFLRTIEAGLKSGCIHQGNYEHTILGTPQGGIASPILFNIYMSKLDEFILNDLDRLINQKNIDEKRSTVKKRTISYKRCERPLYSALYQISKIIKKENKDFNSWSDDNKKMYVKLLKVKKETRKQRMKVPYLDKKRSWLRYHYVRYADDWIFMINSSREYAEVIKGKIAEFLRENLFLELSDEKTKITNLKESTVNFLGFEMGYHAYARRILKTKKGFRRTTGNQLVIGIDRERIEERLKQKKFFVRGKPRRKPAWSTLSDYEIVMRYNSILRGLVNYYGNTVRDFSILNKYIYIFYYSCAHTLANKHRSSLRKIFKKYGHPIVVKRTDKNKEGENKERVVTLMNYELCKTHKLNLELKDKPEYEDDFMQVRINWKTIYKLDRYCVVCGSTKDVQMHHIKHVRKVGQKNQTGFKRIIDILNRKQIMVCRNCHWRIHKGLYDGMNLSDLYDPDLATF